MTTISCVHKSQIGCALTAAPGCCSCSDTRPYAPAYPIYIDGQGLKMQGKRWSRYCWRCKDHWNSLDHQMSPHDNTHSSPLSQEPTWAFPTRNLPDLRYQSPFESNSIMANSHSDANMSRSTYRYPDRTTRSYLPPHLRDHTETVPTRQLASHSLRGGDPGNAGTPNGEFMGVAGGTPASQESSTRRQRPLRNPFGTPEELQADDYQSPISSMFTRAWDRYRTAEDQRRETAAEIESLIRDTGVRPSTTATATAQQRRNLALTSDYLAEPTTADQPNPFQPREPNLTSTRMPSVLNHLQTLLDDVDELDLVSEHLPPSTGPNHQHSRDQRRYQREQLLHWRRFAEPQHAHPHRIRTPSPPRANPIDTQPRPAALSTSDMTVSIACRICNEQRSDTLLEPCMHIAMCRWCSEIIRAEAMAARRAGRRTATGDREGGWKCPICRGNVLGERRVFLC
jgi:hypothetical protein